MTESVSRENSGGQLSKEQGTKKKDDFHAKIAFYLSLAFWVPLFNIATSIVGIVIATKALKDYFREPEKYGGLKYSITALVLCISSIVFSILGFVVYLLSEDICASAVCQAVV